MYRHQSYTCPNLLAIQLVRCRVVGIVSVFRWSPNYAIIRIVNSHVYFCEATDSPLERIAVSKSHFGFVSRVAVASECMDRRLNNIIDASLCATM